MNRNAKAFVESATELFGENAILSRDQIQHVVDERSVPYPFWFVTRQEFRANRGQYRLPDAPNVVRPAVTAMVTEEPAVVELTQSATIHVLRQKKLEDHASVINSPEIEASAAIIELNQKKISQLDALQY